MNKYEEFLSYIDFLMSNCREDASPSDNVREVLNMIKMQASTQKEKPLFTETGFQILEYLQSQGDACLKASDIAIGMNLPSRTISGSIRKLVTDNFVQKSLGKNPVIYSLTELGKNFNIEEYKESLKNEKGN